MVVVNFLVFVSEVVSIFSQILTWIIGGAKGYLCPTNSIIGGARAPAAPHKSTLMTTSRVLRFSPSVTRPSLAEKLRTSTRGTSPRRERAKSVRHDTLWWRIFGHFPPKHFPPDFTPG